MGEAATRLLTVDEFLDWDDGTDRRYQLLNGVVTMMAPPQALHGSLVNELGAVLRAGLKRPCRVITEAGIKPPHRNDAYYQADLAVTCRPLERGEVYLPEPRIVVEVISPSTAATDRVHKLDDYRRTASITDILLVATSRIEIEHWHRQGAVWVVANAGPGENIILRDYAITIDIDALYADLPVAGDGAEPPPA
ncbi:MAG: Uma2 family endonuclease [Geminicoccaceae bacterium]